MKKKMGILGGLLMAVVVTGYSVSGTYAKYTSSIDLADDARVARWSLSAKDKSNCEPTYNADGTVKSWKCSPTKNLKLFAESYTYNGTEYVKAINDPEAPEDEPRRLFAPGTNGEYQVNLAGTIEVRYHLDIEFDTAEGEEEPTVKYGFNEKGELVIGTGDETYRPIKYSVVAATGNNVELNTGMLSLPELKRALADWNADATLSDFGPGRMGRAVTISWQWDTTNEVVTSTGRELTVPEVDALDTYLAEHWRENHPVAGNEGNDLGDSIEYHFVVTATQVTSENDKLQATNTKYTSADDSTKRESLKEYK